MTTRRYVDLLLKVLSDVLLHPSLPLSIPTLDPCSNPDLPVGTFVGDIHKKIASIGIQVRRHVTSHGFALNVERGCETGFTHIVPCGLSDTRLISVNSALSDLGVCAPTDTPVVQVTDMIKPTIDVFGKLFGREMRELRSPEDLGDAKITQFFKDLQASPIKHHGF